MKKSVKLHELGVPKRTSLKELGVPTWHPEALHWRRSYLEEVESGELIGKEFKTSKGKRFICKNITKNHVYFHNIKMQRKYALFLLPTKKQFSSGDRMKWIKDNYPGSTLHIGNGCQLHGDIDATLRLADGTAYSIPWNY